MMVEIDEFRFAKNPTKFTRKKGFPELWHMFGGTPFLRVPACFRHWQRVMCIAGIPLTKLIVEAGFLEI